MKKSEIEFHEKQKNEIMEKIKKISSETSYDEITKIQYIIWLNVWQKTDPEYIQIFCELLKTGHLPDHLSEPIIKNLGFKRRTPPEYERWPEPEKRVRTIYGSGH